MAAASRIPGLVGRGWVPVAAGLDVRYHAPAGGEVVAIAEAPADLVVAGEEAAATGGRVKASVPVRLEAAGQHVATVTVFLVFQPPQG